MWPDLLIILFPIAHQLMLFYEISSDPYVFNTTQGAFTYYLNICGNVTAGGCPDGTSVCQSDTSNSQKNSTYSCGTLDTQTFSSYRK